MARSGPGVFSVDGCMTSQPAFVTRALARLPKGPVVSEQKRNARDTERASPFLKPGETVRAAVWGYADFSRGIPRGRSVVVTEANLYIFENTFVGSVFSLLGIPRPTRIVASYPIGSVSVRNQGSFMHVGDEFLAVQMSPGRRPKHIYAALGV
jgi:hypothetical protein